MEFRSKYIVPVGAETLKILNTGDWRTQRPVMDQGKCIKCGLCFLYCPVNSIGREEGKFVISYEYCKGCGICAHECPKDAITMLPEEGK